jgi:predicted nucleic acid-binding protein
MGRARLLELESKLANVEIIHRGPELVSVRAQLRADCRAAGHAMAQREHNADRWIAATAIGLGIPLVSNDGIFQDVPGLELETISVD